MRRTISPQPTEVLSTVVSNAAVEATRVTGASRHHCDTPAAGICQPEPALNRCGSMRLTNFHYVQRACTPPHVSKLQIRTAEGRAGDEARGADGTIPDKLADSQISFSKKSNNVVGQDCTVDRDVNIHQRHIE